MGAYASIGPLPHGIGRLTITGACLQPGHPKWESFIGKEQKQGAVLGSLPV